MEAHGQTHPTFGHVVFAHIKQLISNLNKKNYKVSVGELSQLLEVYGHDAHVFLLQLLIGHVDLKAAKSTQDQTHARLQLLAQELGTAVTRVNFVSLICQAFTDVQLSEDFCGGLARLLKLSFAQHLALGVALSQSREAAMQSHGTNTVRSLLGDFSPPNLQTVPHTVLPALLGFIRAHPSLSKDRSRLLSLVQAAFPPTSLEATLLPLIHPEHPPVPPTEQAPVPCLPLSASQVADAFEDLGYGACVTVEGVAEILSHAGPGGLEPASVARVVGMMARTPTGLPSDGALSLLPESATPPTTWDVSVFVSAVKSAAPSLDWSAVMCHLDSPSFHVSDVTGLTIISTAYKLGCAGSEPKPFPTKAITGRWKNTRGQLSLLSAALKAPSEALVPLLQASERRVGGSGGGTVWSSVDLVQSLLFLADCEGVDAVAPLLQAPKADCPDTLLLALASCVPAWGPLRRELFSELFKSLMEAPPGAKRSQTIREVWECGQKAVLMGLVAVYKAGGGVEAALEVAGECGGLVGMLSHRGDTNFVLDLAAAAAQRHSFPIMNWLSRAVQQSGDGFALSCVEYVRERGGGGEASSYVIRALEEGGGGLSESVKAKAASLKPRALFAPEIEEEANLHFQRIYRSEVQIEGVIQMLKGFKASQVQREQEVFGCMIHNLFDEYRFFPRYPERELLITGKLFGSLIQHQLVSSITLGIALRYVLEALRKQVSSSMFKFGMCALEQFKHRLVEWPQYCHHILQISHIRQSHESLITFIQQALAQPRKEGPAGAGTPAAAPGAAEGAAAPGPKPGPVGGAAGGGGGAPPAASDQGGVVPGGQEQAYGAFNGSTAPTSNAGFSNGGGYGQGPIAADGGSGNWGPGGRPAGGAESAPGPALDMGNQAVQQTLQVMSGFGGGAVNSVDMLMQRAKQVPEPDVGMQDRVHFVFNNLSSTNLDQKERDLTSSLSDVHMPWLSQYIVIKRASQEANYQALYLQFLDRLDKKIPQLSKTVLAVSVDNIKTLMSDEKITTSSSLRSLLKNLGSWLGGLTLSKNKPILQRNIDFKQLLLDAYDRGRLIAIVPFVAKVLESCANSRIFAPPNPWTMHVLGILAGLHPLNDLKLNIKFEIEVLCKNLNTDIKDLRASTVFEQRPVKKEGNNDWTSKDSAAVAKLEALPTIPSIPPPSQAPPAAAASALQPQVPPQAAQAAGPPPSVVPASAGGASDAVDLDIAQYVVFNAKIPLFQQFPQVRQHVVAALSNAIKEIISPVVERSVTIACITSRELILKDFAFEAEEGQLKVASHLMVQNLAGSLALVTCKEPLRHSMCNQLRAMLQKTQVADSATIDQVSQIVASENLELGCSMIEKAATDKAVLEIDTALDGALQQRHTPGNPFFDTFQQQQHWMRYLPESLRPRAGRLAPHHKRVYEDFAKLPRERAAQMVAAAAAAEGGGVEKCVQCVGKAEEFVMRSPQVAGSTLGSLPQGHELQVLMTQFRSAAAQCTDERAIGVLALKMFRRLYDASKFGRCPVGVDWLVGALSALNDACGKKVAREMHGWLVQSEGQKTNRELVCVLVGAGLLNLSAGDYTVELLRLMDGGRGMQVVEFVVAVLQQVLIEKRLIGTQDCVALLDALSKIAGASRGKPPEAIVRLLEEARKLARAGGGGKQQPQAAPQQGAVGGAPKDYADAKGMKDAVRFTLEKLAQLQSGDEGTTGMQLLSRLLQQGWLKGDETTDRFLLAAFEVATDTSISLSTSDPSNTNAPLDALSKLLSLLLRSFDEWRRSTAMTKETFVTRSIGALVKVVHNHHAERKTSFNQRPYHRLFVKMLTDLRETVGDHVSFAVGDALIALQPRNLSAFAFAWLEILAHRLVMPKLLQAQGNKGWLPFHKMLVALFQYMEPWLRNADLPPPIKLLYNGTLRVLLVLLHDFPEFLCEYHFSFCDVIPTSCVQLRNLVLSAFPLRMALPDPFTPHLKVDLLPEISVAPTILSNFTASIAAIPGLRNELDAFLKGTRSGSNASFVTELIAKMVLPPAEAASRGSRYNVPLVNSVVLYSGVYAISHGGGGGGATSGQSMELLMGLVREMDSEGRYRVLNAIANQLRFPNSHTHYFSCVLLFIFQARHDAEIIREQITRVLIERLIVNKPHPWGLLITFIELIKNPTYDLWRHDFVRGSREIEQLFQSVARFCLPQGGAEGSEPAKDSQ